MNRTESMQELQNSETVLKSFIAPKLLEQGTLVGDTGIDEIICFDSGGNVQFVEAESCESVGLLDSPPFP